MAVEIKPAYSMDTGDRSIWDEIAGLCGTVVAVNRDDTAEVQIKNGDQHSVHLARLKLLGGIS